MGRLITENTCRRCGRQTLGGWSGTGEFASVQVRVDAAALTPLQELTAVVAGCRTWTLHPGISQLHPRTARTIRTRPAGTPRQTVHADHVCTPTPWRSWT